MKRIALIACALCIMTSPLMASDLPEQDTPLLTENAETMAQPMDAIEPHRMVMPKRPEAAPVMAEPASESMDSMTSEMPQKTSEETMMEMTTEPMEMTSKSMDHVPPMAVVKELVIAERVSEREPVSPSDAFPSGTERLYCFSRISSKEATTVTHVWYRNNKQLAEISLNVGVSGSWRTWSSKAIPQGAPSIWRVEVHSEGGEILAETAFTVE